MLEYLTEYGYQGLFLASFLAATILPLSSELVLTYLLANGFDPVYVVIIATIGNTLGAVTNYAIGFGGSILLVRKVLRISELEFEKTRKRFEKYGIISLLFAWVPIIGDPLTVVAGSLKINFSLFLLLVTIGKFLRYLVVAYLVVN
ncbi:MAG: DedA family protein [Melioribacteraceae bacterium]|nr:DedA family protein [Melioribacteraceae bacterium]